MKREVDTKFFDFRQNNSGGSFDFDENAGISVNVIVEAMNKEHAISRASEIGLYFDGSGDCSCCGNRWSDYLDSGTDKPTIYGMPIEEYVTTNTFKWMGKGKPEVFIHYLDGKIKGAYNE